MKKPVVDYRNFRFSKIFDPQFSHLLLLLGWIGYFLLYVLTERFIPVETCYVVHSKLDDLIPFCEIFVLPYVIWFALVFLMHAYTLFYDVDGFKKMMKFIILTYSFALAVYFVFPNCQQLRPLEFERVNIFTKMTERIYTK